MSIYRGRNRKDFYLASALYDAIEDNNYRAVSYALIEKGADPNIVLPIGISPFHLAVGNDDANFALNVSRLILQHSGNPNIKTDDGLTPLHIAAAWGRIELVRLLLNCGADPEMRDDSYAIPVEYAVEYKYFEIARLLHHIVYNGIAINTLPDDGEYSLTLDKIIINNGFTEAEYEVDKKETSVELSNAINNLCQLPQTNSIEYVRDWCHSHALEAPSQDNKQHEQDTNCHREDSFEIPKSSLEMNTHNSQKNFVNCNRRVAKSKVIENVLLDYESSAKFRMRKSVLNGNKKGLDIPAPPSNFCKFTEASRESGIETLPDTTESLIPHVNIIKVEYNKSNDRDTKKNSLCNLIETSSDYFTCNEISGSTNILEKNIFDSSSLTMENSNLSIVKCDLDANSCTDDLTNLNCATNVPCNVSGDVTSCIDEQQNKDMNLNVAEVYKYTDNQEGIVLLERRLLVNQKCDLNDLNTSSLKSLSSKLSSLPVSFNYDTDSLRKELIQCGYNPGPITKTTKRVYLKKFYHLKKRSPFHTPKLSEKGYSTELEKTLQDSTWVKDLSGYKSLEDIIFKEFSNPDVSRRWREGTNKSSFTYLLLDPRVTNNLPVRAETLSPAETWRTFISSIFYVGKGKRSRPYAHLNEAVSLWNNNINNNTKNKKLEHILNVWRDSFGVVCLHIFQNTIPVEAYTREAAMITALNIDNIKNVKIGDFYGTASTWSSHQQKKLGVLLLYKAMLIFLSEGERQLRPGDIN